MLALTEVDSNFNENHFNHIDICVNGLFVVVLELRTTLVTTEYKKK